MVSTSMHYEIMIVGPSATMVVEELLLFDIYFIAVLYTYDAG